MTVCISPSGEDTVLQACGLTAEPSALVAGRTAAGQGGARWREGCDQQAAQGSWEDRWKERKKEGKKNKENSETNKGSRRKGDHRRV